MLLNELEVLYKDSPLFNHTRYHKESYVEGQIDYFIGMNSETIGNFATKYYKTIDDQELLKLLRHRIHDFRSIALSIMCRQMDVADAKRQKNLVEIYLENLNWVNNWDLVDISASKILGSYLYDINDFDLLHELSNSDNLWHKRVAIVATYHLIKNDLLQVTLDLIDTLITEKHDLMHKACGWMLRELGKKDTNLLTDYLETNYIKMPRTMLRYAIEKYPENIRKRILKGDFLWR
ncbi:MAG: DNA alkylation repair protein [Candidatus Izemoplasmatales bacterium]|jgi:3-methyladenine DNA glycosylase AlkD|nr:DNA alkylation repair protein [Candidatus Izemoplasmatales bacterium]